MHLTEQQLNFFHTFGFIHIPQLFAAGRGCLDYRRVSARP